MRKIMPLFVLLLLATAFAQEVKKDSVDYYFNPVVVTANKFQGAQRDIAASITVIDEQQIERAATNSVLELVKNETPGAFITERGVMGYGVASGAAGGLSIRGIGGSPVTGVLVLRDGRPDIMGQMGHPLADAYSLNGIERIEVVRGPESFLYGTNAMGGVINIVSKKITTDGFSTDIEAGAGNFGSQKLGIQHGAKLGKFDYLVTARTQNTDGHRDFSDYDGDFYTLHTGYAFTQTTSITLNANLSNIKLKDPGPEATPYENHWYDIQRNGADVTLTHASKWGESNAKLHGNFGEHKIYDGWHSHDRTVGFMFYHNTNLWSGNTATFGFDVKNYGGDAKESENQTPMIDYSEYFVTEWAPYVNMQQLFAKHFIASAGLRVENHEIFGTEVLPKIGLVAHVTQTNSIRISAAKGFRSPAIRELYVFPPRNKDLQPEEMWNYELGITQDFTDNFQVEAVGFMQEGDNMIRQTGQFPNVLFVNSAEFSHSGYELVLRWQPLSRMRIAANWSDMDLGDESRETPEQKLGVNVFYDLGFCRLNANVQNITELYGADMRQNKLPDYTLLSLSAFIPVWQGLGFNLYGKNLLDESYQTMLGYPMPGRTFMAEARYSF